MVPTAVAERSGVKKKKFRGEIIVVSGICEASRTFIRECAAQPVPRITRRGVEVEVE